MSTKTTTNADTTTLTQQELISLYCEQLDDKEKIAFRIAREHLKSSFNIVKSIGFKKWLQKNNYNI